MTTTPTSTVEDEVAEQMTTRFVRIETALRRDMVGVPEAKKDAAVLFLRDALEKHWRELAAQRRRRQDFR